MKIFDLRILFFLAVIIFSQPLKGQERNDQKLVKQIYEMWQDKNTSSQEVADLLPNLNWNKTEEIEKDKERYTIRLNALLKNEWRSLEFKNLKFLSPEENKVLVTGTVKGRQPTECEFITKQFTHFWIFKNGEIVSFSD